MTDDEFDVGHVWDVVAIHGRGATDARNHIAHALDFVDDYFLGDVLREHVLRVIDDGFARRARDLAFKRA